MARAHEAIEEANVLLEHGKNYGAVSRAYYAAFYAAKAALALLGKETKTHHGVRTTFGKEIIAKRLLPVELGKTLARLMTRRQTADYEVTLRIGSLEATELVSEAERFVKVLERWIRGRGRVVQRS